MVGVWPLEQLAPYNTYYERLDGHLRVAGVRCAPNHWDAPIALAKSRSSSSDMSPATSKPSASSPVTTNTRMEQNEAH